MIADLFIKDAVLFRLSRNALVEVVNGILKRGEGAVELCDDLEDRDERTAKGHKTRQYFPSHIYYLLCICTRLGIIIHQNKSL